MPQVTNKTSTLLLWMPRIIAALEAIAAPPSNIIPRPFLDTSKRSPKLKCRITYWITAYSEKKETQMFSMREAPLCISLHAQLYCLLLQTIGLSLLQSLELIEINDAQYPNDNEAKLTLYLTGNRTSASLQIIIITVTFRRDNSCALLDRSQMQTTPISGRTFEHALLYSVAPQIVKNFWDEALRPPVIPIADITKRWESMQDDLTLPEPTPEVIFFCHPKPPYSPNIIFQMRKVFSAILAERTSLIVADPPSN